MKSLAVNSGGHRDDRSKAKIDDKIAELKRKGHWQYLQQLFPQVSSTMGASERDSGSGKRSASAPPIADSAPFSLVGRGSATHAGRAKGARIGASPVSMGGGGGIGGGNGGGNGGGIGGGDNNSGGSIVVPQPPVPPEKTTASMTNGEFLVHMMKEAMPVMHGMQTMLAGPNGLMASQAQTAQGLATITNLLLLQAGRHAGGAAAPMHGSPMPGGGTPGGMGMGGGMGSGMHGGGAFGMGGAGTGSAPPPGATANTSAHGMPEAAVPVPVPTAPAATGGEASARPMVGGKAPRLSSAYARQFQ